MHTHTCKHSTHIHARFVMHGVHHKSYTYTPHGALYTRRPVPVARCRRSCIIVVVVIYYYLIILIITNNTYYTPCVIVFTLISEIGIFLFYTWQKINTNNSLPRIELPIVSSFNGVKTKCRGYMFCFFFRTYLPRSPYNICYSK